MAKMKFRAHETFFIRKGWLSKGMRAIRENPLAFMSYEDYNPMDALGLGSNMVKSLRYWMQATEIASEPHSGKRFQSLTADFGEIVYREDPYLEEMGTLWAIHCNLACNKQLATSWFFFFNRFNVKRFTKDDFTRALDQYVKMNDTKAYSIKSLGDDFDCILGTYISREKIRGRNVSPENNIDCPLGELGILDVDSKRNKTYKKKTAIESNLDPLIVEYCIRKQLTASPRENNEIPLNELLNGDCYPGKIFNLDSVTLLNMMYKLEDRGIARIIRTAGMDVVRFPDADRTSEDCLNDYYSSIK